MTVGKVVQLLRSELGRVFIVVSSGRDGRGRGKFRNNENSL